MKRTASAMDESSSLDPNKRFKADDSGSLLFASLPTDLWQEIAMSITYRRKNMYKALRQQLDLGLTCKKLNQIVKSIWHHQSSKLWPTFYNKVMKSKDARKFNEFYYAMRCFSARRLEVWDGAFSMMMCPIDKEIMTQFGEFNELQTCDRCVELAGQDWKIIWKLDYDTFICGGCKATLPFKSFTCELCKESFCNSCAKDRKFPGVVYCGEDFSYCNNCAKFCEHCGNWGALTDEVCETCQTIQCERCADDGCNGGENGSDYEDDEDSDEEDDEDNEDNDDSEQNDEEKGSEDEPNSNE